MRKTAIRALGLTLLCAATVQASTTFIDFNSDPVAAGLITSITGAGAGGSGGTWEPSGGIGAATNANDGFLQITGPLNSQSGIAIFPDFDNGALVEAFTFDCWVRIGNGTSTPADGFSIAYVRSNDPVLTGGSFAEGPDSELNMPEEGTTTGISVGFDAYANGGSAPWPPDQLPGITGDIVGLDIRVDGTLILQYPMPTLNGSVTDPTSIQTGPYDGTGSSNGLGWAHCVVSLNTSGALNVYYKGAQILTNYATGFVPSPGQLVLAGRTGGLNENQDVDNITITTTIATGVAPGTVTGIADGVRVLFYDSGPGVVNPTGPATVSINGGPAVPATAVSKNGTTTTLIFVSYPTLLAAGSTNTVVATVTDTLGRVATTPSTSFVVPAYPIVDAATAVTGVTTADVGFRMKTWQSSFEWNNNWWAQEQLEGLHGTNEADTTLNTDKGYYDYATATSPEGPVGVINMDFAGNADGYFTASGGYTDNLWPGLTSGANGLANVDHCSADIQCFLKFPAGGVYTMGVDSDDGFKLTTGANPSDWGATIVGQYNGGRGWNAGDTVFTFVVTNAGIYPFRLQWENGTGGANCEWWSVVPPGGTPSAGGGIRVLINDPDPTNQTGIVAYYGGPALPAYVSWEYPEPGSTLGDPLTVKANITDLGTTVTAGSIKVYLNGNALTPTVGAKVNGVTPVTAYQIPPLAAGTAATAQLVYSTSGGGPFTNTWTYTVPAGMLTASYPILNAAWAVTGVDTSKPGFRLRPWQSGAQPNTVQYTEEQLAGLHGANNVDPALTTDIVYSQSYFDYTTNVINFDISGQNGDFQTYDDYPDLPFPGIPALNSGQTGSSSLEALAYLYFDHPGLYTMDVNSDDGFQVTAGANPADWLTSTALGNFNAGRGSSESFFSFLVTNAGYYPFRLIYENGNGELPGNGANLEWSMVDGTGTPHLLNDPRTEGEFGTAWAYYSGPLLPAFVSVAEPYPGTSGLPPTNLFQVSLTDGGTIVQQSSLKLFMNGAQLTPIVSKAGGVTTLTMPAAYLLPPGSDTAMLVYTTTGTGGGTFTNSWSFTVLGWGGINPAWAVTGVDTTKPGFLVRPWQSTGEVNASQPNDVLRWTEEQMVGVHGVNLADLSTATDHGYIDYATGADVSHLINWNNSGQIGDFQSPSYPDIVFPGSRGVTTWNNSAEEVITYMSFSSPGLYEMGVNSDDGFTVKVGANPKDWLTATVCGDYEGGRGSSDTLFFINVTNAGTYPIRLLYENGGGGFNCEWFVVQPDGTKVLINDPTAAELTGVQCYYAGPALPAYVSEFWPAPGSTGDLASQISVELTDGSTTVNQSSISLMLNGVAVTNPVVSHSGGITKVSLPSALPPGSYAATFSYTTSGGKTITDTWSFVVAPTPYVTLSTNLWTPPGSGSDPGFAMKVYQCEGSSYIFNGWDNIIRRADLGLQGLYGTNIANTAFMTNNGEMWWDGVINFAQNSSGNQENNGNFETDDGVGQPDAAVYTDSVVPGLPGLNAGTINGQGSGGAMDWDAWQAVFFLEFPAAGPYTLGVDSDDCFQLTEGDQGSPGASPLHIIAPASAAGDLSALYTTTADPDGNNGFGITPPSTVPILARAVLCSPPNANSSSSLLNASALAGNVAVFYHNGNFQTQARMAYAAGAIAVVCGQTTTDAPLPGTRGAAGNGTDPAIPCIEISYASYEQLTNSITQDANSPVIVRITAQDCSPICGVYSTAGGRGASDTLFTVMVPKAGLYPFRLIWDNGGGDADCELFSVDNVTGNYTLVNSDASPIKAWITRNVDAPGALPAPKLNQPSLSDGNAVISWSGEGELWEAYSLDGPWFKSTYQSNPSLVAPSSVVPARFFRVRQY